MTARRSRARRPALRNIGPQRVGPRLGFIALMSLAMAQGPSAHAGPFEVRDNGWEGGL